MKRIATILLLAGLGTGCATTDSGKTISKPFNSASKGQEIPGIVGPTGEPVLAAKKSGVVQASFDADVQQTAGFARIVGGGSGGCNTGCDTGCDTGGKVHMPGLFNRGAGGCNTGCESTPGMNGGYGRGIIPAPPMGPMGAVAGVGMIGPGMGIPVASNMRTSIRFVAPRDAKVTWYAAGSYAEPGLSVPADYNFAQANIYRLKVSGIPSKPGKVYYPTLEVAPATMKSLTFLDHGTVPVSFTDEDLARVDAGNLVTKVIYLPDSLYQDVTVSGGTDEVISTQLEPGADPIVEANRRGTILAIVRLGNINLENANSPAKDAPPAGGQGGPNMTPAGTGAMAMPAATNPVMMTPISIPSPKSNSK